MEVMGCIIVAVATYSLAIYAAVKVTVNKLGARSNLFGVGLATMFTGFIWHELLQSSVINEWNWDWYNDYGNLSLLYYVLAFGSLIMGLSGIVMMAVDVLKAVNELSAWVAKKDVPLWKQIQIQQQAGEKE